MREYIDRQDVPLYVFACFMKSGKQHYVVRHSDRDSGKSKWYPADCVTNFREEEIFNYRKYIKKHMVVRKFVKEQSVFAQWKLDDANVIRKCMQHDTKWWKIHKFVKD